MHSLVVLCLVVATAYAATPFFESPHNERASAFYKVPLNPEYHQGAAPVHRPPPSYHSAPAYRPESSYQHRPQAAHYQPSYRPQPSHYQPSSYRSESSHYQPSSYGHGHGGHGATSFQTVQLGEPSYGHQNSHY